MSSSESQREQVRAWRKDHPHYQRTWQRKYKQWRDEERAAGHNVKGGSVPRVSQSKLAYSINVTNPLLPEEKIHHEEPPHRQGTKTKSTRHSHDGE